MISFYSLSALTVFLSSFLLFQVQPLMGKHLLPWFGGGSAVWITVMLFFMVALGIGYGYVLLLSRASLRWQRLVHLAVLLFVLGVLLWHGLSWPSAITPNNPENYQTFKPVFGIFSVLFFSIGAPFILLSSTSTLLQLWYGTVSKREPFSLYALSNVGSLFGLLSYPFLFEPFLSTIDQGKWWTNTFFVYLTLMILVLVWLREPSVEKRPERESFSFSWIQMGRWVFLTSVPVMAMLFGTSFITSSIVVVPLLWIVPLALYLVSFIISFQNHKPYAQRLVKIFVVMSTLAALMVIFLHPNLPIVTTIIVILLALFGIYHLCHEALYASRPSVSGITLFYVALSLGGIVGSLVVTALSFYLLTWPIEFPILLFMVGIIVLWRVFPLDWPDLVSFPGMFRRLIVPGLSFLFFGVTGIILSHAVGANVSEARNFFGYKAVMETKHHDLDVRWLMHGSTNHGGEIRNGEGAGVPITYYSATSGFARAFTALRQERGTNPLRVAIIGAGSGTLAAFCRPGDTFLFFEIDPQVVTMATRDFSYLDHCAGAQMIVADGRLGLSALEKKGTYTNFFDVIVLDAYADDMVPMHLLTKEATALYRRLIVSDGILIYNLSSRYLDLSRVIAGESEPNFPGRFLNDTSARYPATASLWAVLSKDQTFFDRPELKDFRPLPDRPVRWTDTYSALFPILQSAQFPRFSPDKPDS